MLQIVFLNILYSYTEAIFFSKPVTTLTLILYYNTMANIHIHSYIIYFYDHMLSRLYFIVPLTEVQKVKSMDLTIFTCLNFQGKFQFTFPNTKIALNDSVNY